MPWQEVNTMSLRREFVTLASVPGGNIRELCRRYRISERPYPETLPPIEYGPGDEVRKVHDGGRIHYRGKVFRVGQAFDGYPVALRPTRTKEVFEVYFCQVCIRTIHLQTDAGA